MKSYLWRITNEIVINSLNTCSAYFFHVNPCLIRLFFSLRKSFASNFSTIKKYNVFGFYLKNSYSAHALTKRQFFDISLGGGIHGAFPMIPIGLEAGLLYSPINNNLIFEDFVGYMGEKITAGLRTNIYFDNDIKALLEVLFAWNFRFDIRNKTYNKLFEEKAAQNQNGWHLMKSYKNIMLCKN